MAVVAVPFIYIKYVSALPNLVKYSTVLLLSTHRETLLPNKTY